jgi:hypothetical protein
MKRNLEANELECIFIDWTMGSSKGSNKGKERSKGKDFEKKIEAELK